MLVNPSTWLVEAESFCKQASSVPTVLGARTWVDERAVVTTPFHVALNRTREYARGVTKHGTTGMGISETVLDSLSRSDVMRCGDLRGPRGQIMSGLLRTREALLPEIKRLGAEIEFDRLNPDRIVDRFIKFANMTHIVSNERLAKLTQAANGVIFEGAQGLLLDENYGFHPHTTWSTTTDRNARNLCFDYGISSPYVIGVTRTYGTRHGAGPFPGEEPKMGFPELHNNDSGMAGTFRQGYLHLPLLKYAAVCMGQLNGLAVSHLDCQPFRYCDLDTELVLSMPCTIQAQEGLCRQAWRSKPTVRLHDEQAGEFPRFLASELSVPLCMTSDGPTHLNRQVTLPAGVV
jgi:adenylosuccinate synthase